MTVTWKSCENYRRRKKQAQKWSKFDLVVNNNVLISMHETS